MIHLSLNQRPYEKHANAFVITLHNFMLINNVQFFQ
jgi:hypothetical protein